MKYPDTPDNEVARLKALQSLQLLDSMPENRFDRITGMAQRLFDMPIVLISLVDFDRQWFKSKQGLAACETSREISFCGHAILGDEVFVVENTLVDERFQDNPLVLEEPNIQFYAGCPIHAPSGERIGTLCLIDYKPHVFTQSQRRDLRNLASLVDEDLVVYANSTYDELTRVSNRLGISKLVDYVLSSESLQKIDMTLLVFDLVHINEMQDVNDREMIEFILTSFAARLKREFRRADVVARTADAEFCVLTRSADSEQELANFSVKWNEYSLKSLHSTLDWYVGTTTLQPGQRGSFDVKLREAQKRVYYQQAVSDARTSF